MNIRAKLYNRKRYAEKIQMKKQIKMHEQKETKNKKEDVVPQGAVPAYLLDRYIGGREGGMNKAHIKVLKKV